MALLPFSSAPYNQNKDTIHVLKAGDTMTGQLSMNNSTIANAPIITAVSTDTNQAGNITAISITSNGSLTSAPSASFLRGMFNTVQIAASNTQNWTGLTGLVGMQNTVNILAGATGVITNATALLSNVQSSSSLASITNAYGIRAINLTSGSGTITNNILTLLYGLGSATNNTGIYLATANTVPTAPTGNFAIYDTTGYTSYFVGKIGINTLAPGGQFQITTGSSSTIGEIIKGAPAQSVDLTEWQDSTGTILALLRPTGEAIFGTQQGQGGIRIGVSNGAGFAAIRTANTGALEIQGEQTGATGQLRLGNPTGGILLRALLDTNQGINVQPSSVTGFGGAFTVYDGASV